MPLTMAAVLLSVCQQDGGVYVWHVHCWAHFRHQLVGLVSLLCNICNFASSGIALPSTPCSGSAALCLSQPALCNSGATAARNSKPAPSRYMMDRLLSGAIDRLMSRGRMFEPASPDRRPPSLNISCRSYASKRWISSWLRKRTLCGRSRLGVFKKGAGSVSNCPAS